MIVNRFTRIVKNGCMQQAIELVQAEIERVGTPDATRVCTAYAGPSSVLIIDFDFDSIAEMDQYWSAWRADPESTVFGDAFNKLTEAGGGSEIWRLHD